MTIQLININKSYLSQSREIVALRDINLTVQPGDIFGVIGKSGAGKSTLIRCVNLLERPSSGQVIVGGQELSSLSEKALRQARHGIGMVFQHFNLLTTRTVYQNIAFPLQLIKKTRKEIDQAVMPLLELTGLKARAHAYPSQLSGGQKQRVAIAQALATQPQVLLCDEMTSSLDPETTKSILKLVKDINLQMQLTILLITHEMDVIKNIADHVAVIDHGSIIEQADVVSLFKVPKTDIAKAFTRSTFMPELPPSLQKQLQVNPIEAGYQILRIAFMGETTTEPVMNNLIKHHDVQINILQANVEMLRGETLGMMVVALRGKEQQSKKAIAYLTTRNIDVEVLGYVAADDWINH